MWHLSDHRVSVWQWGADLIRPRSFLPALAFSDSSSRTGNLPLSSHFKKLSLPITILSVLPQAAMTNYHSLGDLDNRHLLLTVLESGSPGSGCQHGSVLGVKPISCYRWSISCCILTWQGEKALVPVMPLQGHQSHHRGSTSLTLFKPHYFPKALPTNTITLGIRNSMYELRVGDTNIQSHLWPHHGLIFYSFIYGCIGS